MAASKQNTSRYHGYRTPYHDEICSERILFETLAEQFALVREPHRKSKSQKSKTVLPGFRAELLPIGRQVKVFEKEKLDLLALDRDAILWVFEFKRDVAQYGAIAQLLTYGGYVARWSRHELLTNYDGESGERSLEQDFQQRFNVPLPAKLTHQVNLVLAAYEFSLACRRGLQYLDEATGLVIGQLKIECLWDMSATTRPEYQWLRAPTPTRPMDLETEPSNPAEYYTLSEEEDDLTLTWSECLSNGLLPLPGRSDAPDYPLPVGSGIFVHLCSIPSNCENGLFDGLVGYGLTTDHAFDLRPCQAAFEMTDSTHGIIRGWPGKFWVLPMRWVQKHYTDELVVFSPLIRKRP